MALVHGLTLARSWTLQQVYASLQRRDMLHRKGTEANHNGEGITQPGADAKQTARQSRKNNYSFLRPLELLLLTFSWIYKTTASVNRKPEKNKLCYFFFNHPVSTLALWYLFLLVNERQNLCESGIIRGAYSTLLGTNRKLNTTTHFIQLLNPIVTMLWRS